MKAIESFLKKIKSVTYIMFICFLVPVQLFGQSWPVITENRERKITVFKPSVENQQDNVIDFRAAIAVLEKSDNAPVFGSIWGTGKLKNNSSGTTVNLWGTVIDDIRFPDGITEQQLNELAGEIEDAINARQPELAIDDIVNDQLYANQEREQAAKINNNPPRIYYSDRAAILVNIDGDPIVQGTGVSGVEMVVNTPFLILKFSNNYYLGNGTLWYRASSMSGNFVPEKNVPNAVVNAAYSLKASDEDGIGDYSDGFYPRVIVTFEPGELIQTDGPAQFSAIQGTNILFVTNTEEHLLLDINRQAYFVLLSGRWFTATKLDGTWKYVQPDKVPADFAKIPEGSEKDAVLASVYGTRASKEAVRNSMVPQAAVVERNNASSSVIYDGNPEFEPIQNTNLQMAVNSSNTVIVEKNRYYLVDNGIWFTANSPNGPWYVSDYRPAQVVYIPPSCPAYNVKYVEIYYSTPTVVYVGYTSGYVSSYVSHNVVVYGTGHRYRHWHGRYYYPRPCTWGYGMVYNPWYGWSINVAYGIGGYGWFAYGYPSYYYPPGYYNHYCHHGWWGPPVYRPPYHVPYSHCYGHQPAHPRPIYYSSNHVNRRPTSQSRPVSNVYGSQSRPGVVSSRPAITSRPTSTSSRETYNYSHAARPTTSSTRPGSTGQTQPGTRPDTSTRPGSTTTTTRPGSTQTGGVQTSTRPATGTGTETRPSTRPESGTTTRPGTSQTGTQQTGTRQTGSGTGATTGTVSRPSTRPETTTTTTRPNTPQTGTVQTGTRQQTGSGTSSSSTTETKPSTRPESTTTTTRPANNQTSTQKPSTRPAQTSVNSGSSSNSNRQQSGSSSVSGSSSSSSSGRQQSGSSSVSGSSSSSSRQQSGSSSSGSSSGSSSSGRSEQQGSTRR